jgi:hypothetical protein
MVCREIKSGCSLIKQLVAGICHADGINSFSFRFVVFASTFGSNLAVLVGKLGGNVRETEQIAPASS